MGGFEGGRKERDGEEYLRRNSSASIRTRAQSICNTFSISRFADSAEWCFEDLMVLTYEKSMHSRCRQPIQAIYCVQTHSKTRSVRLTHISNALCFF